MIALALIFVVPENSGATGGTGGYSRPATNVRTPSVSGGYRRPGKATTNTAPSALGATDRALARRTARQALEAFRAPLPSAPAAAPARRSSVAEPLRGVSRRPSPRIDLDLDDLLPWLIVAARTPSAGMPAPVMPLGTGGATPAAASSGSWGLLWFVLLLGVVAAFALHALLRRRSGTAPRAARGVPVARPAGLRVGMTLPFDPAPFLLAAPVTTVRMPTAATASGMLTVNELGVLTGDTLVWWRLYVADGAFFQLHLDTNAQPDECRYFSLLDEVTPADAGEWALWLGDEGLIGWPEFQTQDGRLYRRQWTRGTTRIAPRAFDEHIETGSGAARWQRQQAMLYARATLAAPPAPPTEYLWVAAIEQDDAAWVALYVGIDMPCALLTE